MGERIKGEKKKSVEEKIRVRKDVTVKRKRCAENLWERERQNKYLKSDTGVERSG